MTSMGQFPVAIHVITSNPDLVIFVALGGWNTICGLASIRQVMISLLVMIVIGAPPAVNNSTAYHRRTGLQMKTFSAMSAVY